MILPQSLNLSHLIGPVIGVAILSLAAFFYQAKHRKRIRINVPVIGISGLEDHGKDTLGDLIQTEFDNFVKESFAGPVKQAAKSIFMLTDEQINGSNQQKRAPDPFWSKFVSGVSARHFMRWVGTKIGRESMNSILPGLGDMLWIRLLERRMKPGKQYVVCDVRFENECDWIRGLGGLIVRVVNPNQHLNSTPEHVTNDPNHLPRPDFTVVNSGTKQQLLNAFTNTCIQHIFSKSHSQPKDNKLE